MIRPFPKPHSFPKPKPQRLPKGTLVTIAAGILCDDGLVLCADTEETITDDRKGATSKIRVFQHATYHANDEPGKPNPAIDWCGGIVGAGHSDWVSAFVQGMSDEVLSKIDERASNFSKLEKSLDEYTQRFFAKYIRSYAEDPLQRPIVDMLVLMQFTSNSMLHEIFRINGNLVLRTEADVCVAVGKGAPVFKYLADRLLIPSLTIKQAASIAVYIMDRVKSEVPGCGGNSHIGMIGSDGKEYRIPTRRIKEMELHHTDVELRHDGLLAAELIKELP